MGEGLAGGGFGGEGCGRGLVGGGRWGACGEVSQGDAAAGGEGEAWDVHCFLFFCVGYLWRWIVMNWTTPPGNLLLHSSRSQF